MTKIHVNGPAKKETLSLKDVKRGDVFFWEKQNCLAARIYSDSDTIKIVSLEDFTDTWEFAVNSTGSKDTVIIVQELVISYDV